MKNTTPKTKPASAQKAPKMKLEREIKNNAVHAAVVTLGELPTALLKTLCKYHEVPVAKYKDEMVERLAVHLIKIGRRVIVKIF